MKYTNDCVHVTNTATGAGLFAYMGQAYRTDFLGVEVHRPGVGHLMLRAAALDLTNLRVACCDAVEFLRCRVPDGSLDEVLLYFPDPWPKKRHHKPRIVQSDFVALVALKLRAGGAVSPGHGLAALRRAHAGGRRRLSVVP